MTDSDLLREKIRDRGYKLIWIADKLGITANALNEKMKNLYQFKQSEIRELSNILGLSMEEVKLIFFTK